MTQLFSNNVDVALEQAADVADTSLLLTNGSGLHEPIADEFELLTVTHNGLYEIVKVIARSGNTVSVERGHESTTPRSWPKGARVFASITAGSIADKLSSVLPSDLIATASPADGEVPTYDEATGQFLWGAPGAGSASFSGLTDTPANYTAAGELVRINSSADGLEFDEAGPLVDAGVAGSLEIDGSDLQLVGDTASPGANKVYGTDGSGARGWKDDPAGGGSVTVKNSIEDDGGELQLVGDAASPGNDRYYGTNESGVKGYHELPEAGWTPDQTTQDNLTAFAPMALPAGATAFGTDAVSIQPERSNVNQVASGNDSVSIGKRSQSAGARSVSVGASAFSDAADALAIGPSSYATGGACVAVGRNAYADGDGATAVGRSAVAEGANSTAVGSGSTAENEGAIAIGRNSRATEARSIAIGDATTCDHEGAVAINGGETRFNYHRCAMGLPAALESSGAPTVAPYAKGVEQMTLISGQVELSITGEDGGFSLPAGVRFYPNEVGIIVTVAEDVTAQPEVSFGSSSSSLDDLLAATTTTGLDAVGKRQRFTNLLSADGITEFWWAVTSGATADPLVVRFYISGFAVCNE